MDKLRIEIVQTENGYMVQRHVFQKQNYNGPCSPSFGPEVYVAKTIVEAIKLAAAILKWQEIK